MKSIVKPVLSLFLICFISVGLLAAVYMLTESVIESNNTKAINASLAQLYPGCDYTDITTDDMAEAFAYAGSKNNAVLSSVYGVTQNNQTIGYVVVFDTKGYVDSIALRVGINSDGTVNGIIIGENTETAGLGAKIAEESFYGQFSGKRADGTIKLNDDINGITGATYSSRYVVEGVNIACSFILQNFIAGE